MFKKVVVITLLGLIPVAIKAGWWRVYGGDDNDRGRSISLTPDGGYIATGVTKSFGIYANDDLWLLKFDSLGDTVWTKVYAYDYLDWGHYVTTTSDSGYIIGARSDFNGNFKCDIWLLKTDSQGDTLWTRHYGKNDDGEVDWVEETADGGYILAGEFSPFGMGACLIKTDENGDSIWSREYPGVYILTCAKQTSDGGFFISGAMIDSVTGSWPCYWLCKTGAVGEPLWSKYYMRGDGDFPSNFEITPDGGCVIFGKTGGDDGGAWVVRTDENGDTLWTRIYPFMAGANFGQITEDGGLIMTGSHYVDMGSLQDDSLRLALIKTDENGSVEWQRTYGRHSEGEGFGEYNCGYSLKQLSDGGYIICGESRDSDGNEDFYLIRTDSLGLVSIEEERIEPSNWSVSSSIGSSIILRYSNYPQGFHASVFDASGRKVDELHSAHPSGTITWGDYASRGVYFIRPVSDNSAISHKVVLVR